MPYLPTQEDIRLLKQKALNFHISFDLLNNNFQTIDVLQGGIISGTYTIDGNSDIRRTLDVVFHVKNKTYYVNETSKIWIDKMVRVKYGIENLRTKEIHWYPMGIFIFTDYNFQYDSTNNSLSLSCVDLMAKFTGLRGGSLTNFETLIPAGSNIREALISTVTQLGWVKKYIIEENKDPAHRTVPYDLNFPVGTTLYEVIEKLTGLYNPVEFYFDEDIFVAKEIAVTTNDPIMFDNSILGDLIISENSSGTFNDVKNCIEVFGKDGLNGRVMLYNVIPENPREDVQYIIDEESPFSVEKIDEIWDTLADGEYANIYTQELIYDRCSYELWLKTALKDDLSVTCILIPFLYPYQKIEYKKKSSGETVQAMVQSISIELTGGVADIEMNKFRPLYSWL